tara:strand:- start:63 stop:320 length:258 start_codon:yes stop_codon:yes gene_type:complete
LNKKSKKVLRKVASVLGLIIGVIYILNPTFGVFELIPDNLPYIGNLDEASAVLLILGCLKELKRKEVDASEEENPDVGKGPKQDE